MPSPEIAKVIRDAQPNRERMLATNDQIRPGHYTASDLARLPPRSAERRFMAEHERLKRMGLEEVKPIRAGRKHVVAVLPMTDGRRVGPFDELLQQAVDENATKLGEVVGHEKHLAVYILRFDLSTSPNLTALPQLPPEVDLLLGRSPIPRPGGSTHSLGRKARRHGMAGVYSGCI